MKICPNEECVLHKTSVVYNNYCIQCGTKLIEATLEQCPACDEKIYGDYKFCPACGRPLK